MNTKWELQERSEHPVGTLSFAIAVLCAGVAAIVLLLRLQLLPVSQPELVFRSVLTLTGLTMANLVVFGLIAILQGRSPRQPFVAACLFGLFTNVLFIFLFDRVNLSSWYPVFQIPVESSQRKSEDRIRFRYRDSVPHTEVSPTNSDLPHPLAVDPRPHARAAVDDVKSAIMTSTSQTRVIPSMPHDARSRESTITRAAQPELVDRLPVAPRRLTREYHGDVAQVIAPRESTPPSPTTDMASTTQIAPADVASVRATLPSPSAASIPSVPTPRASSRHPFAIEVPSVSLPVAPSVLPRIASTVSQATLPAIVPLPNFGVANSVEPPPARPPYAESLTALSASETNWEIDALADRWWEDSLDDEITSEDEQDQARAEMIKRIRPVHHADLFAVIPQQEPIPQSQHRPTVPARRTVTPVLQSPDIVVSIDAMERKSVDWPEDIPDGSVLAPSKEPDSAVGKSKFIANPDQQRFIRDGDASMPEESKELTAVSAATNAMPFQSRLRRLTDRSKFVSSTDEKTDVAIEAGLEYLARCQLPDGSWRLQQGPPSTREDVLPSIESGTAATGLALLAFLGAGYHHQADKYRGVVANGLSYLVEHQANSGDLYVRQETPSDQTVWMYSHAIAAMTICEAYGMTQDSTLRAPAQRALDFIVSAQHPELGGWRYAPGVAADTSVSGWMLVAIKSGEISGLQVSDAVYDGVRKWLDQASFRPEKPYLYRYNPFAGDSPQQRHGRVPSRAMSAVGMVMGLYLGTSPSDQGYKDGMEQLERFPPQLGTLRAPLRDAYYWYYATLAAYYAGGETWNHWNRALRKILLDSQIQRGSWAGSWDPLSPVPDRWAEHGGRLYVSVMNLLCLEVEYRHLPIYQAKPSSDLAK